MVGPMATSRVAVCPTHVAIPSCIKDYGLDVRQRLCSPRRGVLALSAGLRRFGH